MMHPLFEKADAWTGQVIAAAIEVHRRMGPGLLEEIYERCLMREMEIRHIPAENQVRVPIEYKGMIFEQPLRLDLYVDSCLIVEIKAVEHVLPIHKAQLISYMKLLCTTGAPHEFSRKQAKGWCVPLDIAGIRRELNLLREL